MKKVIAVFLVLLGLMGFSGVISQALASPTVALDCPETVVVGEQFEIGVNARDVTDGYELLAFGFDLEYPGSWTYDGYTIHSPFLDDSPMFEDTDVAGSTFPPVTGSEISLASLFFTPSDPGTYTFEATTDVDDLNEGLIFTLSSPQSQIYFNEYCHIEVVPLPGTLIFLGSGLVGLVGLGRRKKEALSKTR